MKKREKRDSANKKSFFFNTFLVCINLFDPPLIFSSLFLAYSLSFFSLVLFFFFMLSEVVIRELPACKHWEHSVLWELYIFFNCKKLLDWQNYEERRSNQVFIWDFFIWSIQMAAISYLFVWVLLWLSC